MLKLSEIKHQASIFLPFPSVENCRLPIIHLLVRRSFDDSSEINFSKSKREGFSNGGGGGGIRFEREVGEEGGKL